MKDLTSWQKAQLFSYLDIAAEHASDFPDGAWLAYLIDSVSEWCSHMTTGPGLSNLMLVDGHDAVIMWLQNAKGTSNDSSNW